MVPGAAAALRCARLWVPRTAPRTPRVADRYTLCTALGVSRRSRRAGASPARARPLANGSSVSSRGRLLCTSMPTRALTPPRGGHTLDHTHS